MLLEQLLSTARQAWSAWTAEDVPRCYGNKITTSVHAAALSPPSLKSRMAGDLLPALPHHICKWDLVLLPQSEIQALHDKVGKWRPSLGLSWPPHDPQNSQKNMLQLSGHYWIR